jgi:hypothetical protein
LQVKVGLIKRSKKLKAPVPELLTNNCPTLKDKLGTDTKWVTSQTALSNYEQNGFVNEPNRCPNAKSHTEGAERVFAQSSLASSLEYRQASHALSHSTPCRAS